MAFLDNTGDIILDAVITDEGRVRLAKGDFQITKFALGDDEINYKLYSSTDETTILKTPIFEAFTNNIASLNSRLITLTNNNILYLPIMLVNDKINASSNYANDKIVKNGYVVAVDSLTEEMFGNANLLFDGQSANKGYIKGFSTLSAPFKITIDQGINSDDTSRTGNTLMDDLIEQNCLMEMDDRFIVPVSPNGQILSKTYVDEDYMASYYVSNGDGTNVIFDHPNPTYNASDTNESILGPRGIRIEFSLASALSVSASTSLFYKLGSNVTSRFTISGAAAGTNIRQIVSSVRVTGLTTGYAIDVPIVLIKKIS